MDLISDLLHHAALSQLYNISAGCENAHIHRAENCKSKSVVLDGILTRLDTPEFYSGTLHYTSFVPQAPLAARVIQSLKGESLLEEESLGMRQLVNTSTQFSQLTCIVFSIQSTSDTYHIQVCSTSHIVGVTI